MSLKRFLSCSKKILINGGIFVLIGFFTYRMVFSQLDFGSTFSLLSQGHMGYLFCGLLMILFMLCAEAYAIKRNLRLLEQDANYSSCLLYAFTGNFFSAITPAATGGQPMQLYLMHKNKIPVSKGTLALFMDLGAYQVIITGLGIAGYIGYADVIHRALGEFVPILWLGLALNIGLLILTFCAMFSERFIERLLSGLVQFVAVFSKTKSISLKKKAEGALLPYRTGAAVLKKNKVQYLFNFVIMLFRILAMHSAPFWVYKALGFSQASCFELIALQSVLYISCAALPFPGGVGIGESAFLLYFKEIFPTGLLGSAMALSRGLGVYTVIAFCGLALLVVCLISMVKNISHRKAGKFYRIHTSRT